MVLRITEKQSEQVNALVRKLCCYCSDDSCSLLDDETEHTCVQLISRFGIYCKYFRQAVLPADEALYAEILKHNNLQ